MRVKDSYSLCVDELLSEIPTENNLPVRYDSGITPAFICGNCAESLNLFEALGNYIAERSRTKNLTRQVEAAENALDARNDEAQRQSEIILDSYTERLNKFLAQETQKLELETQRIEMESAAQVEQIQNARERESARIRELVRLLEYYRSFLNEEQKFLSEIEVALQKFMTRNKFYYQVKEDYRIKVKWISNLLNQIDK